MEYREVKNHVEVPKAAGVTGFLLTVEKILKLPRVQEIHIDARGKVSYRHYVREGEPMQELQVDLESVMPYAVVRNSTVSELVAPDYNAAVALGQLFDLCAADHLFPTAFIAGPTTEFWKWYEASTTIAITSREELYGVPILLDRFVEDRTLILCASFSRTGVLVDTQRSYKLVMPQVEI